MSRETIYKALRASGLGHVGACAILGNMQAESGLSAAIAQRGATELSDAAYTAKADAGELDFAHDGVGYGLCQWTYPGRKAALLSFARERGVSVGDEQMQAAFCVRELRESYPELWKTLLAGEELYTCTKLVCLLYERPAVNNVSARWAFAREIDEALRTEGGFSTAVLLLQLAMREDGYWPDKADGIQSAVFQKTFAAYAADVAACGKEEA